MAVKGDCEGWIGDHRVNHDLDHAQAESRLCARHARRQDGNDSSGSSHGPGSDAHHDGHGHGPHERHEDGGMAGMDMAGVDNMTEKDMSAPNGNAENKNNQSRPSSSTMDKKMHMQ